MNKIYQVKACRNHEKTIPLRWTFAFNGSEYWCPYCGENYGMMGAGEIREVNFTEARELIKWRKFGGELLDAMSTINCSSLEWNGKRISPHELPDYEKKRVQAVIDSWEYEADKEEASKC